MRRQMSLFILFFLVSISRAAYAVYPCETMHVQLVNNATTYCQLSFMRVLGGSLMSLPPQSILVNDSKTFDMSSSYFYGPDIILEYSCGAKSLRFEVKQSGVSYERPSLYVIATNGLIPVHNGIGPSHTKQTPGMITIAITNTQD